MNGRGTGLRPTRRGSVLLAGTLVALVTGLVLGIGELCELAVAGDVLLAGAALWVRGRRWEVRSVRLARPERVTSGATVRIDLSLSNTGARTTPVLEVVEGVEPLRGAAPPSGPGPGRGMRPVQVATGPATLGARTSFLLAPLGPGALVRSGYELGPLPRGRYRVGPLELRLGDPFGLVRRTRVGAPATTLTVHPHVPALATVPGTPGRGGLRRDAGSSSTAAGEFSSLRAYRDGDDLRQVHWASTARLDRLMVRQADADTGRRCTVALDLRPSVWPGRFEEVLAAAAGVLDAGCRQGGEVRLVTSAGTDSGFGRTTAHRGELLDRLAGIDPIPDRGMPPGLLLPEIPPSAGTWVVLTSTLASPDDLAGLPALAPPGALLAVLFEVAGEGPSVDGPAGRLLRVPREATFAEVWDRLGDRSRRTGSAR